MKDTITDEDIDNICKIFNSIKYADYFDGTISGLQDAPGDIIESQYRDIMIELVKKEILLVGYMQGPSKPRSRPDTHIYWLNPFAKMAISERYLDSFWRKGGE